MPVISVDFNDLMQLFDAGEKTKITKKQIVDALPMLGASVETLEEGGAIDVELNPNRPDLYSVEGIARALRNFLEITKRQDTYKTKQSGVLMYVDKSVKTVRPYIACALIRNVKMSDRLIASLMDVQEKLHLTYGRKRKKVSIGIHDFKPLKPPFTYKAVAPKSVRFVPLAHVRYMDLAEILKKHEKGVEYAWTLEGFDTYPIITDAKGDVLSFPPIINGALTAVTENTRELLVEVTGTDESAVGYAANIIAAMLYERGGAIETVDIIDGKKTKATPQMTPRQRTLDIDYVNAMLSMKLTPQEIAACLEKMGYTVKSRGKKAAVSIPSYRVDVLHPIDLVEDVAVAYGYDALGVDMPKSMTFGEQLQIEKKAAKLRAIMIGLGFNEIMTLTLTSENEQFSLMNVPEIGHTKIENPLGLEHTMLRTWLLPSALSVLRENKHNDLPQNLFEISDCVVKKSNDYVNVRKLTAVKTSAKTTFSEIKALVEALLRDYGVSYRFADCSHGSFISGRCASIVIVSGRREHDIGVFGEIHPEVITRFELTHPVTAFELTVENL